MTGAAVPQNSVDPAAFGPDERISCVNVIEGDGPPPSDAVEQDRKVAAFELSEESALSCAAGPGPYAVTLERGDAGVRFLAATASTNGSAVDCFLPDAAFAPLVNDYVALCGAYREAVLSLAPAQIEALDQERRAAHGEAGEALAAHLAPDVRLDAATARRLFTLVCALRPGAGDI